MFFNFFSMFFVIFFIFLLLISSSGVPHSQILQIRVPTPQFSFAKLHIQLQISFYHFTVIFFNFRFPFFSISFVLQISFYQAKRTPIQLPTHQKQKPKTRYPSHKSETRSSSPQPFPSCFESNFGHIGYSLLHTTATSHGFWTPQIDPSCFPLLSLPVLYFRQSSFPSIYIFSEPNRHRIVSWSPTVITSCLQSLSSLAFSYFEPLCLPTVGFHPLGHISSSSSSSHQFHSISAQ